jgi:O-antigen/teichoic acid export membrane protein
VKAKNLSEQFVSATLWNTILFPARLFVGLLASVLYYQRLSLDQVGVLFLLTSLAATIGLYADLGIERTLPRFLPEVEREAGRAGVERLMRRVIRLKLVVLLVLVGALAVFAGPLVRMLAADQRREIAALESRRGDAAMSRSEARDLEKQVATKRAVLAEVEDKGRLFVGAVALLLLLGALFDVYMQFLTAYLKQRSWNLITLASTLLQPVLVSLFILAGWQVAGVLLGLVLAPLVCVMLARWQVRRASRELGSPTGSATEDAHLRGRFARFAAVNYLMQVTTWMYDLQFVIFLSAATLSLADVALLGFAYKFTKDFLGYVWTPLTGVITPVLARVHVRGEPKALAEAHATLTRVIWLLVLPAGVGLAVLAPRLVAVLYPKYTTATVLIVIFVASTFGESLLAVPHNVLMVAERYRVIVASRLLALVSIPLVYVLLPRYGLVGVAIGVGLARIAARMVTVVYGMKEMGLRTPLPFLGRVALASGGMGLAILVASAAWTAPPALVLSTWERGLSLLPLAAFALGGALVYALLLRLLGGLDEAERRRLLDMRLPFRPLLARLL